jgi:hypothetical protein
MLALKGDITIGRALALYGHKGSGLAFVHLRLSPQGRELFG